MGSLLHATARISIPSRSLSALKALKARSLSQLKVSSVRGSTSTPLLFETLPGYYSSRILPRYSSRPALISTHESPRAHGGPLLSTFSQNARYLSWTFEDLDRHASALARGLISIGVKKGDRVGVLLGNTSAYAALQWACSKVGAIMVTINPAYRIKELVVTLNLVGVSTLFIAPRIRTSDYLDMLIGAIPSLKNTSAGLHEALPSLKNLVVVDNSTKLTGDGYFQSEMAKVPTAIDFRDVFAWDEVSQYARTAKNVEQLLHHDDIINLQFTSGTTGAPKAVSLSHHNLLNNGYSIGSCMNLTPEDKLCNVPPLFHCFGLVLGNLAAWVHGSSIVYASESYDPLKILDALHAERCTGVHGVPTHFLGLLAAIASGRKAGKTWDLSSLRTGIAAGSTIPIDLMRQLIGTLNLRDLTIAYGMTETSPVSFQTVPSDPIIKRVETVGRVQPHVKAKVVDEHNVTVPIGQPGELCVSGYLVQKGYWDDPEQTASVLQRHPNSEDGGETEWMHTGDQAVMDEEGYLRIVGRIKDLIIRGGENLFPVQIENTLTDHPSIREAAVVAVPDKLYGETVGAWIVRDQHGEGKSEMITGGEVRAWVAKNMNPQNAPTWVWFIDEEESHGYTELPKTASGKVQKNILREWSKKLELVGEGKVLLT